MQLASNPALLRLILLVAIFVLPQLLRWLQRRNSPPPQTKPSTQASDALREALRQRMERSQQAPSKAPPTVFGRPSPGPPDSFGPTPTIGPTPTFGAMEFPDSSAGMPKKIEPELAPVSVLLLLAFLVALALLAYRALAG